MNTNNSPSSSPTQTTRLTETTIYPWDEGPAVVRLQEMLYAHGFRLKIDGSFGSLTEAAVKSYQRRQGLRVDGVVGPKTWAALRGTIQPGTRLLKPGCSGQDVNELQGLLRVHGYDLERNGIFDTTTHDALLNFQHRYKLRETGLVDSVTWTMLRGKPLQSDPPKQNRWFFDPRKFW